MIRVYRTYFDSPLPNPVYHRSLALLSAPQREQVERYHHWQDRLRALLGKLLLRQALQDFGLPKDLSHAVKKGKNGRPYLNVAFDFNISHSGGFVLCATSPTARVGIDVEEVRPIELENFTSTMTPGQWTQIHNSDDPLRHFFTFWTIKESVIKADGIGISKPLNEMEIGQQKVELENTCWHFRSLSLAANCACSLASNAPLEAISWVDVQLPS